MQHWMTLQILNMAFPKKFVSLVKCSCVFSFHTNIFRWCFISFFCIDFLALISGKLSRWLTFLTETLRSTRKSKIVLKVICGMQTRLFVHSGSLGSGRDCNNLTDSDCELAVAKFNSLLRVFVPRSGSTNRSSHPK